MYKIDLRNKLLKIIRENALTKGRFILSSGRESDYYIDIKKVSLDGEFLDLLSDLTSHIVIENFETKNVAGVELGGVPLATATMLKIKQKGFDSKAVVVRKKVKEHGTQKWIEGPQVDKVVLIEDVITTGGTTIWAIEKIKENNINVEGVLCVVDRGGLKNIPDVKTLSLFNIEEILLSDHKN